jgi:Domain of unknown function (DUF4349)
MSTFHALMIPALILMMGCSEATYGPPGSVQDASPGPPALPDQPPKDKLRGNLMGGSGGKTRSVVLAEGEERPGAADNVVERKIVRTANVTVIVQDFETAQQELRTLIARFKNGYIAQAEITGLTGSPRRGHWKIRVPARDFDTFRDAVAKLGVPEKNGVDSQDVTEEYYDLDTRVKNKKVEEQRLLKHLEKSTAKLEEILTVEREISRVRGEIEQLEGRQRLLANLTALTTVDVTIQEIKNYVPAQAPTFASRISKTFSGSIDLLVTCGRGLILVAVALAPWLPILALVGLVIWVRTRRHARRAPTQGQAS